MEIDKNIVIENYNNDDDLIKYISKTLNIHIERLKIIEKFCENFLHTKTFFMYIKSYFLRLKDILENSLIFYAHQMLLLLL